jgi:hypothetical protein
MSRVVGGIVCIVPKYLPNFLSLIQKYKRQFQKDFTFGTVSVLKKVNFNAWQTCHDLFCI